MLRASAFVVLAMQLPVLDIAAAAGEEAEAAIPKLPPPTVGVTIEHERCATGRRAYLDLITREAEARGLPPAVADAVATVESGYDPAAVGGIGEVGLMQVRPTTAAMLGHKGKVADLAIPETNIHFGVAYLAQAWRLAGGDLCRALMKYRAGHGEERMTALSIEYCRRARVHLASVGSPLAAAPLPVAGAAGRMVTNSSRTQSSVKTSSPVVTDPARERRLREMRRLWAEHVERVRKIDASIARIMGTTGRS